MSYIHKEQIFTNAAFLPKQKFYNLEIHEPNARISSCDQHLGKIYRYLVVHVMQFFKNFTNAS